MPRQIPVEIHGNGRFVLPSRGFIPAYLRTHEEGRLGDKAEEALEALRSCALCPRNCRVDRLENRFAVCKVGRYARVSAGFPHFGEEDVLRGWRGSGTIFFAWCNLRCVFCLHPDMRVLTDRGMSRIKDIFALGQEGISLSGGTIRFLSGLLVWTREGRLVPASKVFSHPYRGEMVQVKPYGLPRLMVTPDHAVFAAPGPGAELRKVPAGELTRSHWLFVPKPRTDGSFAELDARALLLPQVRTFGRSVQHRVPIALLQRMVDAKPGRLTSKEIAAELGYHPAYVRALLPRIRRGLCDDEMIRNDLVEENGRIRFKTEKGGGIPSRVAMDQDLARLLGYYCAEGHVTVQRGRPSSYRLVFSFGRHETDLAAQAVALIEKVFGIEATLAPRRTTTTVEVTSTSLALFFASLAGRHSGGKRILPALLMAPQDLIRAFLEAYWKGDGCRQGAYLSVKTVSEELALGLVGLLLRLGVFPYFYATPRRSHQTIEGRLARQVETLYYVKCRREAWDGGHVSARVRYRETGAGFWVPIRRVSRLWYEGPVYNLEVRDQDHSYTASGVAVGNCQNFETSQAGEGEEVRPRELARMMLDLQTRGCHNINFVTPEHVVPQILEALPYAVDDGLRLPIVYNTSAYDSLHSIRLMDGVVDIYMPDFKLWDRERSRRYLLAPNYPEAAREVIRAMHAQVGELRVDEDGLALRGVLVRHLVMPGMLEDTGEVMRFLAGLSRDTYVNVMDQYYPAWKAKTTYQQELGRRVFPEELEEAVNSAREAGLWRLDLRWRRARPDLQALLSR